MCALQAARLWTEDLQSAVSGIAVPPRAEPSFESETSTTVPSSRRFRESKAHSDLQAKVKVSSR